ncbi:MAG: lysophospholipid acyltransferase family protein [Myxococcota bacterium]
MQKHGDRRASRLDRFLFAVGPWLIRAHSWSLRVRLERLQELEDRIARGRRVVLVGWHQRLYMGIGPFRRYHPVIMISQSRDGERIARVVERLGFRAIRGSSSRGGAQALEELIEALSSGGVGGHVVDGPRGPARQVKRGCVRLASSTGAAIVPVFLAARWRWEARSWDRFHLPLPFTRVQVRLGDPIEVPPELSPAAEEEIRQQVEKALEQGQAELDLEVAGGTSPRAVRET